jgi:hypothetical protein
MIYCNYYRMFACNKINLRIAKISLCQDKLKISMIYMECNNVKKIIKILFSILKKKFNQNN